MVESNDERQFVLALRKKEREKERERERERERENGQAVRPPHNVALLF